MTGTLTPLEREEIKALLRRAAIARPEHRRLQLRLAEVCDWTIHELDDFMAELFRDYGTEARPMSIESITIFPADEEPILTAAKVITMKRKGE